MLQSLIDRAYTAGYLGTPNDQLSAALRQTEKPNVELINNLLDKVTDVNPVDFNNAAAIGNRAIFERMMQFPTIKAVFETEEGFSPAQALTTAVLGGFFDIADRINNAIPEESRASRLTHYFMEAAREGQKTKNYSKIKRLLNYLPIASTTRFQLEWSLRNVEDFKTLISVDSINKTIADNYIQPLEDVAARIKNIEIHKILLANPFVFYRTSEIHSTQGIWNSYVSIAFSSGNTELVKHLLTIPKFVEKITSPNSAYISEGLVVEDNAEFLEFLVSHPIITNFILNEYEFNTVCRTIPRHYLERPNRLELMLAIPGMVERIAQDTDTHVLNMCGMRLSQLNRLLAHPSIRERAESTPSLLASITQQQFTNQVLRRLLEFPLIRANATADDNAALRNAQLHGNEESVQMLMAIPEVAALEARLIAEGNVRAIRGQRLAAADDLVDIANNTESSMVPLNRYQTDAFMELKKEYKEKFDQQGKEKILADLQRYLINEYEKNPVMHEGKPVPKEFAAGLPEKTLQELYQNDFHAAYRCLFCDPNPWMHLDACFVRRNAQGATADISDSQKELIAYLWFAVNDETKPVRKGAKMEDLKVLFAEMLKSLGRAHNWDGRRKNAKGKMENFDDLKADKPNCGMGVLQRITQFLTLWLIKEDVKLLPPIDTASVRDLVREQLIVLTTGKDTVFNRIDKFGKEVLENCKNAAMNFISDGCDRKLVPQNEEIFLDAITFEDDQIESVVNAAKAVFGNDAMNEQDHTSKLTFEQFIRQLAANVLVEYGAEIIQRIDDRINNIIATEKMLEIPSATSSASGSVSSSPIECTDNYTRLYTRNRRRRFLDNLTSSASASASYTATASISAFDISNSASSGVLNSFSASVANSSTMGTASSSSISAASISSSSEPVAMDGVEHEVDGENDDTKRFSHSDDQQGNAKRPKK